MRLSQRDRLALAIGAVCLLVFVLVQFAYFPLQDKRRRLQRSISSRTASIARMREMQVRYRELSSQSSSLGEQLASRTPGFSLFSFLEKMADTTDVKQNIVYMKPSSTISEGDLKQVMVEMKLGAVSLKQLVSFLEHIESPENLVAVKRITIQENKKEKETLDVIMQVISLDRT